MVPEAGQLIGAKFRLVRCIGEGGMGTVWEARHEFLGARVALKFLHPELSRRPGLVARFLQEARLSANIASPHVVHVTDVDQTPDGLAYLVMELLVGETLAQLLARVGPLAPSAAAACAQQMLEGLEAAHDASVVHRDLKPDNVFLVPTPSGPLVKLLDFGIAKLRATGEASLTRPGVVMGTPAYMAPEQVTSADQVDARADLYAVGAMLYEMCSGRRPVAGADPIAISAAVRSGQIEPLARVAPGVPADFAAIVHRALAFAPSGRFRTAAEMRAALGPYAGSMPRLGEAGAHTQAPSQLPTSAGSPVHSAVPRTLPPDDERPGAEAKGRTALFAAPYTPGLAAAQAPRPDVSAPGVATPGSAASGVAPTVVPRRRGGLVAVTALLALLAVAAIAAGLWVQHTPDSLPSPVVALTATPAPQPTVAATAELPAPVPTFATPPVVQPAPRATAVVTARDAGARPIGAVDAAAPQPTAPQPTASAPPSTGITIPLPTIVLPPGMALPIAMPTSFTIPGLVAAPTATPPPASSR